MKKNWEKGWDAKKKGIPCPALYPPDLQENSSQSNNIKPRKSWTLLIQSIWAQTGLAKFNRNTCLKQERKNNRKGKNTSQYDPVQLGQQSSGPFSQSNFSFPPFSPFTERMTAYCSQFISYCSFRAEQSMSVCEFFREGGSEKKRESVRGHLCVYAERREAVRNMDGRMKRWWAWVTVWKDIVCKRWMHL